MHESRSRLRCHGFNEPLAICGMAMRLPGGVRNAEAFWEALIEKKDFLCRVPDDRFNVDAFYSPHGKPGTIISPDAFYLSDAELGYLDTSVFDIKPHELRHLDPQLRIMLEVTRESLENAGETQWQGKRIGCYVGTFGEDWLDLVSRDNLNSDMYSVGGTSDFGLSNRTSYEFNFRGPSMTIKSGCSAAMMALNEACWAIDAGECDSAIVGGANLILTPTMSAALGRAALSPTGTCKTFDAAADGYARGEAVTAIYIKRLSKAIAENTHVRAVIRGIGANSDGGSSTKFVPSLVCQEGLIRDTYSQAGVPLDKTGFFECHGTGTRVGDPIETTAVDRVFGDNGIIIGAVKPNFGHSEGASAITSIIKAVLALERKTIPPNMRFSTPNPAINWGDGRLTVPTELISWPRDRDERVSVNSFGIGGANGHVIIDSARPWCSAAQSTDLAATSDKSQLLVLSASHEKSLARMKSSYESLVSKGSVDLGDLAYTLANHRQHHRHRTFCTVSCMTQEPRFSVIQAVSGPSSIVFVFSGQGNVWPQIAHELMRENLAFRQKLLELDQLLASLPSCTFSLEAMLSHNVDSKRLEDPEISQPLSVAIQLCLCSALAAVGIEPDAVIGHSSGEIAAAYASGSLSEAEAIQVAFFRGQAIMMNQGPGAMSAIGLGRETIERLDLARVTIACDNSPSSITLSGRVNDVEAAEVEIEKAYPNALIKRLPASTAYHSPQMSGASACCKRMLTDKLHPTNPRIPYFSALTGDRLSETESLNEDYWRKHMEEPVQFRPAAEALLSSLPGKIIFAEIGPHPNLTSSLIQICAEKRLTGVSHLSFMRRHSNTAETFLNGLGRLYQLGIPLQLHRVTSPGKTLTDLPSYPWHHDHKHWSESRIGREWRFRKYPRHDLLGVRTGESSSLEPSWRNILRLDHVSWLGDHQIESDIVLPFTAYWAMAGEAVQQVHDQRGAFSLRQVHMMASLPLQTGVGVETMTTLRPERLTDALDSSWFEFSIASYDGTRWIKHCKGSVLFGHVLSPEPELYCPTERLPRTVDAEHWYSALAELGLRYGHSFRRLQSISSEVDQPKAMAVINDNREQSDSTYGLHPATLDGALQLIGVAASTGLSKHVRHLFVPVRVAEVYVANPNGDAKLAVRANASAAGRGLISGDIVATEAETMLLQVKGLDLYPVGASEVDSMVHSHTAAELAWTPDLTMSTICDCLNHVPPSSSCHTTFERIVALFANYNPLGTVLHIGSGSINAAKKLVTALQTPSGDPLYSNLTICCNSETTRKELQATFNPKTSINYTIFDIDAAEDTQWPSTPSYELIVVDQSIIEAMIDPKASLTYLQSLLATDGSLLFYEDPPPQTTYCPQDRTLRRVKYGHRSLLDMCSLIGLAQVEVVEDTILIAKAQPASTEALAFTVALLCTQKDDDLVRRFSAFLQSHSIATEPFTLQDMAHFGRPKHFIVSILDLQGESPLLQSPQTEHVLRLVREQAYGILWITTPKPAHATILGLARTARNEVRKDFWTLEIPGWDIAEAPSAILKVLLRCKKVLQAWGPEREALLDPDFEYTFRQGCILVPRFRWKDLHNDCSSANEGVSAGGVKDWRSVIGLEVESIGRLDTLRWKMREPTMLRKDHVELQMQAVGVNFKDVLVSLGVVGASDNALGLEGAGIVTRIGDEVENLKVGDRVMVCGTGSFATYVYQPEHSCCKIPAHMTFAEAATMPCVFLTVLYAFTDLGRLERGESVLIHSGCGGVGLAAIQMAKLMGAKIFVTVGSEEKVQHLMQEHGIPRENIFSSRSPEFYTKLMRRTRGQGVDVVLNSLSGELLHLSWKCVSKFGRMVEIGRRDLIGGGKLDMSLFEGSRTYVGLSLEDMNHERPEVAKRLSAQLSTLLRSGKVKPITPITRFAASNMGECFRFIQKGQHIGKMIVEIPQDPDGFDVQTPAKKARFDPEVSYLLVGGLGGLGRGIARWMAENGAVHLMFFSRTAGQDSEHDDFIRELTALGAVCKLIAGDVCDSFAVRSVIKEATPPIRGIVLAATLLKDASLLNMTAADWTAGLRTKVAGTECLHNACLGIDLDFFIVLGSLSGIVGQHGQSHYNAANSYLNALIQLRHSLKAAGSIIHLSAVAGIGILSKQPALISTMRKEGVYCLAEAEVLEAFHWALDNSKPWQDERRPLLIDQGSISVGLQSTYPLTSLDSLHPWKRDRRMAAYHNSRYSSKATTTLSGASSKHVSQRLLLALQKIHADPQNELSKPSTAEVLAEEIGRKALGMLLMPTEEIDCQTSLVDIGLDSLMAMQLRQWWRDTFRVEVNLLQVSTAKTFHDMGILAVTLLKKKLLRET